MGKSVPFETELHITEGWIPLPLSPEIDAKRWALGDVKRRTGEGATREQIEAAAEQLATMVTIALRAPRDLTYYSLAFHPRPLDLVLATAEVLVVPLPEDEPFTLDIAQRMLLDQDGVVGQPEAGPRQLPGGPAVRVRGMFTQPDGAVLEGVAYVMLPPTLPGWVLLTSRWAALALGDDLAARVDELAVRLTVTRTS